MLMYCVLQSSVTRPLCRNVLRSTRPTFFSLMPLEIWLWVQQWSGSDITRTKAAQLNSCFTCVTCFSPLVIQAQEWCNFPVKAFAMVCTSILRIIIFLTENIPWNYYIKYTVLVKEIDIRMVFLQLTDKKSWWTEGCLRIVCIGLIIIQYIYRGKYGMSGYDAIRSFLLQQSPCDRLCRRRYTQYHIIIFIIGIPWHSF